MQAIHKSECPGGAGHCQNTISDVPHRAASFIVAGQNGEDNPRARFVLLICKQDFVNNPTTYVISGYAIRSSFSQSRCAVALEGLLGHWGTGHD